MATDVQINYINRSVNNDLPTIFVFTKNMIPTFDVLKEGVAWKTIPLVGKGSSCQFTFPIITEVRAAWNGGCCKTKEIDSSIGARYTVSEDSTGIILEKTGSASQATAIEVANSVHVPGGVKAQLYKNGTLLMEKHIVGFEQKATFVLHPKLYWGIASEIQDGQLISSAVLNTDHFFEQDIEGVRSADVVLYGNAEEGYYFQVENQK